MNEKAQMQSHTRAVSIVLIAILIAAALPLVAPLLRENEALAETMVSEPNSVAVPSAAPVARVSTRNVVVPVTAVPQTISQTFSQTYAQAVSMMLVGSLLIAIGSVVRRGI
jgi:hypothetical protein